MRTNDPKPDSVVALERTDRGTRLDMRRVALDGHQITPKPWRGVTGYAPHLNAVPDLTDYPLSLKWLLRAFKNGNKVFFDMIRAYSLSDNDRSGGEARRLVEYYDKAGPKKKPSPDTVCEELSISVASAYGWFSEMAFLHGKNILKVQAAVSAPAIAQASIAKAMDVDEGFEERRMLFEAIGFLPRKGVGPMVALQNNVLPAGSGGDEELTFEQQQRRASALLRAPLKQVGEGKTEGARVQPGHHQPATRNSR